jgi:hypothetical protein
VTDKNNKGSVAMKLPQIEISRRMVVGGLAATGAMPAWAAGKLKDL